MRLFKNWMPLLLVFVVGLVGCGASDDDADTGGGGTDTQTSDDGGNNTTDGDGNTANGTAETAASGLESALVYLNEKMLMATIVHPKRFTQSDLFQALPDELDLSQFEKSTGLEMGRIDRILVVGFEPNPKQIEEMQAQLDGKEIEREGFEWSREDFDPNGKTDEEIEAFEEDQRRKLEEAERAWEMKRFKEPAGAGDIAYVIWLDTPVDEAEYVAARETRWSKAEPFTVGSTEGHKLGDHAVVVSDDGKTIMGGRLSAVEDFLVAKQGSGSLYEAFAKVDDSFDALMMTDLSDQEMFKKVAKKELVEENAGGLPPVFAGMPDAAMKVGMVTARVDVSEKGTLATVRIAASDEAGTAEVKKQLDGALEFGKSMIGFLPLPPDGPPELAEGKQLVTKAVTGITTKVEGNEVVVTLPHPDGTVAFVEKMGPQIVEMQKQAERSKYRMNLKQVGLAFHNYHDVFDNLPAAVSFANENDEPLLSWRIAVLNYLEQPFLYDEFELDEPWDSDHNKTLLEDMPEVFESPGVTKPGMTTLMMFTGPGTPNAGLGRPEEEGSTKRLGLRFRDFTDGLSNTVVAVYAAPDKAVPWTKPVDLVIDPKDPLACVGEIPEGGLQVLVMDGSVQTLPADVAADLFKNLVQHNDGNPVTIP